MMDLPEAAAPDPLPLQVGETIAISSTRVSCLDSRQVQDHLDLWLIKI